MVSEKNAFAQIYTVVRQIPYGKVCSYGQVAFLCGHPRWARVVGYAMAACHDESVPCHRVLRKDGSLSEAFNVGGEILQKVFLQEEGVRFLPDGRVNICESGWKPDYPLIRG